MTSGAAAALRKLVRQWDLSASAGTLPLGIETVLGELADFRIEQPGIVDGIDSLNKLGARIQPKELARRGEDGNFPRVFRAYMLTARGRIVTVPLKIVAAALVVAPEMVGTPSVQSVRTRMIDGEVKVRSLATLTEAEPVRDMSDRCQVSQPLVRDRTVKMAGYPHIRGGVDLERLDDKERESFLQEAATLKGISAAQGELLAIYRNVPVEVISKAHYVEEKKLLLYTLESGSGRGRVRLHDMGVVRDSAAGKIHMVVHRTQFKTVAVA